LVQAACRGEVARVKEMIAHGAVVSARNNKLLTALHWAVTMGHLEVVQVLVESGADVTARDADGNSPLHMAAREGDLSMVQFLLEHGGEPDRRNNAERTPLDLALIFAEEEPEVFQALHSAQMARGSVRRLATRMEGCSTAADAVETGASGGESVASSACGTTVASSEVLHAAAAEGEVATDRAAIRARTTIIMMSDCGCGPDEPMGVLSG